MAPFLILVVVTTTLRGMGALGIASLSSWQVTVRFALAAMFVFTGVTHFTSMKHDYVAMIPEGFPTGLWVIYCTGALEIAGAVGLLVPRLSRVAGVGLLLLLCALFPANVNAALQDIAFRDAPPTSLWLRGPIQLVFVTAVWWSAVRTSSATLSRTSAARRA